MPQNQMFASYKEPSKIPLLLGGDPFGDLDLLQSEKSKV
jgi:hypothetical protein